MTIRSPPGPAGGPEAIATALNHLLAAPLADDDSAPSADARPYSHKERALSKPLPVYTMDLADLAVEKPFSAASQVGWYYLVVQPNAVAIAELADAKGGGGFQSLIRGPLPAKLEAAAAHAETVLAGDADDYEARVLDIPPLYVMALWLHGRKDLFVPVLLGETPITEPEIDDAFRQKLAALAKRKLLALPREQDG